MTQLHLARLHRAVHYDGTNGAAVAAEIPGASVSSGGTGNTTLVLSIVDAGTHNVPPDRHIVWTEYPAVPVTVLDTNLTESQVEQIYGGLLDSSAAEQITDLTGQVSTLETAVSALEGAAFVQAVSGTTDSAGSVTLNWPVGFGATPQVTVGLQTGTNQLHSARVTALSASSVTIHVSRAPVVTVLSIAVLGSIVDAAGVTVHVTGVGVA